MSNELNYKFEREVTNYKSMTLGEYQLAFNRWLQDEVIKLSRSTEPNLVHTNEPMHKILPILIKDDHGNEFMLENFQQVLDMIKKLERLETELELLKHDWNELVSRHEIQTYELNTLKQAIEIENSRPPEPKKMNDREKTMERWDFWRNEIANGCTSSQPRDWFESLFCEPEPKTEWISVDDRFPKNSGVVLCVSRGYIGAFTGWYEDGIWYDHADGEEFIVTHWQPLPDAPICDEVKKEGNDE